ncbi:MAG: hypothetical protein Kow0047_15710 [Anaerolineae bacterium]
MGVATSDVCCADAGSSTEITVSWGPGVFSTACGATVAVSVGVVSGVGVGVGRGRFRVQPPAATTVTSNSDVISKRKA